MAHVRKIDDALYEVEDFVQSMPHLRFQVQFTNHGAVVIAREGCTETCWDKNAISAVQMALNMDPELL